MGMMPLRPGQPLQGLGSAFLGAVGGRLQQRAGGRPALGGPGLPVLSWHGILGPASASMPCQVLCVRAVGFGVDDGGASRAVATATATAAAAGRRRP